MGGAVQPGTPQKKQKSAPKLDDKMLDAETIMDAALKQDLSLGDTVEMVGSSLSQAYFAGGQVGDIETLVTEAEKAATLIGQQVTSEAC
jgi:hypothetical protein